MKTPTITIFTATYNRAGVISKCFESIEKQTCKDFEWLIIDDGSSDDTEKVVNSFATQENQFPIRYYKKENGGKHTAINYGLQFIKGELTLFLDDDDTLTENAVKTAIEYWEKYRDDFSIWCMSFQKSIDRIMPLVSYGNEVEEVSNTIDFRINKKRNGDCAEVVRTSVLKEYPFPTFPGERFLSEDHLWVNTAYKYKTVYIDKIIYLCDYLEGGLTKSGRKMRLLNPLGGMYTSNLFLDNRFDRMVTLKKAILYDVYSISEGHILNNIKKSNKRFLCFLVLPIGFFLYCVWR